MAGQNTGDRVAVGMSPATVVNPIYAVQDVVLVKNNDVAENVAVLQGGELAGYRRVAGMKVQELRTFYFERTGEIDEAAQILPGSRR